MAFDDRLAFLLLGGLIGFILGYIVRSLHEIKEELDEVDGIVKRNLGPHDRDEKGFIKSLSVTNVVILLVVGLTAWASFVSQKASNDSHDSQKRIERVVVCDQQVLKATLNALNERSVYTKATTDANVNLQQSQADFFSVLLHKPPYSEAKRSQAVRSYYNDLQKFLTLAHKGTEKVKSNPYPTIEDFSSCLRDD